MDKTPQLNSRQSFELTIRAEGLCALLIDILATIGLLTVVGETVDIVTSWLL